MQDVLAFVGGGEGGAGGGGAGGWVWRERGGAMGIAGTPQGGSERKYCSGPLRAAALLLVGPFSNVNPSRLFAHVPGAIRPLRARLLFSVVAVTPGGGGGGGGGGGDFRRPRWRAAVVAVLRHGPARRRPAGRDP